ncbi:MAG: LTA synthase family protein [Candidatus Zixiibacteriota bacterium]|nr:MAG: LTA synthase family protein [candidate division Zixibacteria bacterium]
MRKYITIPNKTAVWLATFFIAAVFFALLRFLFLMAHLDLLQQGRPATILGAFWRGFRFDAMILSIVLLPLVIISLYPAVRFTATKIRNIFTLILTVLFAPLFLLSIADIRFFEIYGSRMNFWAVEYVEHTDLFLYSITSDISFWKLLILWLLVVFAFWFVLRLAFRRLSRYRPRTRFSTRIAFNLFVVALLAFGIRGRLGMKPLDWGAAFFCQDQFVNQLALNSVYTLAHSIYEEWQDGRSLAEPEKSRFSFFPIDQAHKTVLQMLNIDGPPQDSFSLARKVHRDTRPDFLPNLIVILMESWSSNRIGALGSDLNTSPCFDRLASEGILLSNFYANGIRTNRGLPAIICSFPSLPGRSIMKRYAADYPFRSLAEVLGQSGVTSIFAHGGDIAFDNMEGFLRSVGYDIFYGEDDFGNAEKLGKWGVADHAFFERLADEMADFPRPFHMTALSLSYHDPYLIPDNRFRQYDDTVPDSRKLNTFYYTDWSLGRFFEKMRSMPLFDSTIFVITSDHCPHQTGRYPLSPRDFNIPLLIYAPAIIGDSGRIVETIASQVDIMPTLIGLIGLDTDINCWGRDVLACESDDSGFAIIVADEKLGLIEGSLFYFHWVGAGRWMYNLLDMPYLETNLTDAFPETAVSMERRLDSYIQLASFLSRGGKKD